MSLAPQLICLLRNPSCRTCVAGGKSRALLGEVPGEGWQASSPPCGSPGLTRHRDAPPGTPAGLESVLGCAVGVWTEPRIEQLTFLTSITESKHVFPFILGKAGKQVGDKNNQFSRTSLALVISSPPKKYNFVLLVQSEGQWAHRGCGVAWQ